MKPTRKNRKAKKCTRLVPVRGNFIRAGKPGLNKFRFSGRLGGHKLPPAHYDLVATPTANGHKGRAGRAPFRIVR